MQHFKSCALIPNGYQMSGSLDGYTGRWVALSTASMRHIYVHMSV